MAGRADCDLMAALAAGRQRCSFCEQVRADQIRNGAKKLRDCHRTTTTLYDVAASQSLPAPGFAGQQRGGYGAGWGSGGFGMPPMPQMTGYGGYGMPRLIPPSASEGSKRKRSEDADDDQQGDDLDRQIREMKRVRLEQEKRKQLRELQDEVRKEQEEERAREVRAQDEADRHEALARQRQRDAYDEERRINESYREENRRGWDRGRSRSPISRSESQQAVRRRSPAPDPNSMVDWERRSKNVQSQLWILNQRIDRERRAHEIQAKATRQATDAVASGGDVNMSPPPTGPRPGGRSRQRQDLREQRERWSRE
ncbi:hypothetical protein KC331_g2364 [Hortaea werneckii]|nr:hypothetical protein KC354_g7166 [Hortaea werneckii]KAI7551723.1 hypothetical protein KC331_g2364 [Hortaea werneckii]KAI7722217.1 hypothetical protein KC353_g688 [Hortaea werneckii]